MEKNKDGELLIDYARGNPTIESSKAEIMFRKFLTEGFCYDDISSHPDYPVYASAQLLATILPLMIDEMFAREDTGNFLIYHIITAVDPQGEGKSWLMERTAELINLVDNETTGKIIKLLIAIRSDAPVSIERLDRLTDFWRGKWDAFQP